jgi:ankyrin repeat protein
MFEGNVQVMKYLLDRGGNPRRKTPEGLTVLHAAAARGDFSSFSTSSVPTLAVFGIEGQNLYLSLVPLGLCEPLKLLLSEGHPADIMLEDHGGTPLHAAASGGQDDAMKILLEHGADVSC